MGIRQLKPTTPSARFMIISDFAEITRSTPEESLLEPLKSHGGRNNQGHVTTRYKGGGHKRMYRRIDFRRDKHGIPGKVAHIEYDPNRSARIALIQYPDGEKRYILHPRGLQVGDAVLAGPGSDIRLGNAVLLIEIPLGTSVHNVELKIGRGGQLVRSAGAEAQVVAKEGNHVTIKLMSGEVRMVRKECFATIGTVGNAEHELESVGKAGKSRWLGKRSRVRRGHSRERGGRGHGIDDSQRRAARREGVLDAAGRKRLARRHLSRPSARAWRDPRAARHGGRAARVEGSLADQLGAGLALLQGRRRVALGFAWRPWRASISLDPRLVSVLRSRSSRCRSHSGRGAI